MRHLRGAFEHMPIRGVKTHPPLRGDSSGRPQDYARVDMTARMPCRHHDSEGSEACLGLSSTVPPESSRWAGWPTRRGLIGTTKKKRTGRRAFVRVRASLE